MQRHAHWTILLLGTWLTACSAGNSSDEVPTDTRTAGELASTDTGAGDTADTTTPPRTDADTADSGDTATPPRTDADTNDSAQDTDSQSTGADTADSAQNTDSQSTGADTADSAQSTDSQTTGADTADSAQDTDSQTTDEPPPSDTGDTAGYEWDTVPIPAAPPEGAGWQVQPDLSDDFGYHFGPSSQHTAFGDGRWTNFYHNGWNGPGTTYWQYDHVSVDGDHLVIRASRNPSTEKMGVPGVNAGCVTSASQVTYPAFVEASISVANIALASDVWLLSSDDTQEIDIIECYGGADNGNAYFAQFIHMSHHAFIRSPFTDYQPRDRNSWWGRADVTSWGAYSWNGGNRRFVRVGVYWVDPFHFRYYVDGQLVRVVYHNAFATLVGDTWEYTYPTMTNGTLDFDGGYQAVVTYATGATFDFATLQQASDASGVSVIDPYGYLGGTGYTKPLDIIINIESQDWHVNAGRTPTDADLADPAKNTVLVDWIRVYKPAQ